MPLDLDIDRLGNRQYIFNNRLATAIEFSVWIMVGFRLLNCTCAVNRSYSDISPLRYCNSVSSTVRCTVACDSSKTANDCSANRML